MDLNIENYSIPELMIILNVTEDATRDDVMKQSSILIEKFTKENKLVFADANVASVFCKSYNVAVPNLNLVLVSSRASFIVYYELLSNGTDSGL